MRIGPEVQPGETLEGGNGTVRDEIARWAEEAPGDASVAVERLTVLARAHPSSPEVLLALSLAFTRAERATLAAEALRRTRFLAPNVAKLLPSSPGAAAPGERELLDALRQLLRTGASNESGEYTFESVRQLLPAPPIAVPTAQRGPAPPTPQLPPAKEPLAGGRFEPTQQAGYGSVEHEALTYPYGPPVEMPDCWMLSRMALELWVRRFSVWAWPLVATNSVVPLAVPESVLPLGQSLAWLGAFAVAAPFTLRLMAREWSEEGRGHGSGDRDGAGARGVAQKRNRASFLWTPLVLLAGGGSVLALLSLRLKIQGEELFALGMLASLPLLALLAPALLAWVTGQAGLGSGLKSVKASLSRRGLAYVGVMTAVGGLGGVLLGALGWGFLVTLRIIDSDWIRAVIGAMMSLPESLLLALIASIGLDAQAANGPSDPTPQGEGGLPKTA